jgi:uncharacterized protein YpbB
LFATLREWRNQKAAEKGLAPYQVMHQRTLVQIAVHLPESLSALKRIRGIGKRLAEKYGDELVAMVADYLRKHSMHEAARPVPAAVQPPQKERAGPAVKEDTKRISLQLFQGGAKPPQIAAHRGLALSTIEGHLAFFIAHGELAIGDVVADEKRRAIEQQIAGTPATSLRELKTALGDDCSYGEIRMVLAHLQRIEQP